MGVKKESYKKYQITKILNNFLLISVTSCGLGLLFVFINYFGQILNMSIYITNRTLYSPYINLTKFEPIYGSCEAAMFGPKNTMFILKILILLHIFWHKIFRAFFYVPKCYFEIIKSGAETQGETMITENSL